VICAYLERSRPETPLYPAEPRDFARALWFEEWADTKLAETTGAVFFQQPPDEDSVRAVVGEAFPPLLD